MKSGFGQIYSTNKSPVDLDKKEKSSCKLKFSSEIEIDGKRAFAVFVDFYSAGN